MRVYSLFAISILLLGAVCFWPTAHGVQAAPSPASVHFGPAITIATPMSFPISIATGDINNDGIPDIAVVGLTNGILGYAFGKGDGTFGPWQIGLSTAVPNYVTLADLNLDGNLDVITTDGGTNYMFVAFGNGKGLFLNAKAWDTGHNTPQFVTVADVNGDGFPDIVGTNIGNPPQPSGIFVRLGNGKGLFTKAEQFLSGGEVPLQLAVADMNGDGKPDLVVANSPFTNHPDSGNVAVLLGNGDGTFRSPLKFSPGYSHYYGLTLALGDFNGDGKWDVAVANVNGNQVDVLLGNGDGTLGPPIRAPMVNVPTSVVAADFNGDGKLDLAVANYTSPGYVSVLLGNGDGTFQAPVAFRVGITPRQLVVADFNKDGKPDIAAVNGGSSTVSILLNTTP